MDGKNKHILEIHQREGTLYKIEQKLGDSYIVHGKHILVLKFTNVEGIYWDQNRQYYKARYIQNLRVHDKCFQHNKSLMLDETLQTKLYEEAEHFLAEKGKESGYNKGSDIIEISIENYFKLPNNMKKILYGFKQEVEFEHKVIDLDPYMLGLWLGDGTTSQSSITNKDKIIIDYIYNYANSNNLRVSAINKTNEDCKTYYIAGTPINTFLNSLKKYNLIGNKHNTREIRLKVLAGLMDSDGHMQNNMYEIAQKSDKLTNDIMTLSRSLGFRTSNCKREKKCYKPNGEIAPGMYNIMLISGRKLGEVPVLLDYKKANPIKEVDRVTEHGIGKYVGFQIEGDCRFLAPDFTVWA